jgi:predicted Rossmann fold nucleotide-binding protein DprA/Smf involved in DNA uptake
MRIENLSEESFGSILTTLLKRSPDSYPEEEKRVDTEAQADYIDLDAADYTQEEKALLRALQEGEKSAEELSAETGLESAAAMSALTMLTLQGSVEELGGGRFRTVVRLNNQKQEQK